jgi:Uma2 family endonuclease
MEARQLLYTVEEFEKIADAPENSERLLELIDGEIVEKAPTELQGIIVAMIARWLLNFIITHKIKGRVATEARHRVPKDKRNARLPDVSYRAGSQPIVTKGSVLEMPDLAVEVKSPDDAWKDLRAKARYYLANGAKLVWLVEPVRRFVEVYSPDDEQVLFEGDMLNGGVVLPGFEMPVSAIFEDTAAE